MIENYKKFLVYLLSIFLLIGAALLLGYYVYLAEGKKELVDTSDPKNFTYDIEGREVTLVNGYAETQEAPGSATTIKTEYFGNEAKGDLNGDGKEDSAFLLKQQPGGTGVFYYLVAVIDGKPTKTAFLGDRIAPQTTQISSGAVTVNYADRKPDEPMAATPTVGISKYFRVEGDVLVEQMDTAEFGKPLELVINQKAKFSDGLVIMLKQINDSRCKPGVVCIWAGELAPVLVTIKNSGSAEIILGTSTKKTVEQDGYTFSLTAATETVATITVTKTNTVNSSGGCYAGGCSSHICSDQKDMVSTCEWREAYACYKSATCERQTNGQCGWTITPQLQTCLNNAQ